VVGQIDQPISSAQRIKPMHYNVMFRHFRVMRSVSVQNRAGSFSEYRTLVCNLSCCEKIYVLCGLDAETGVCVLC